MTVDDLYQQLSKEYNLKCFLDIASISVWPTRLYEVFNSLYQPEFKVDDRLVFYSSYELSDDLLEHFYNAANQIDISNFFIMICSTHNIKRRLHELCKKCSKDKVPFQSKVVDLDTTEEIFNNFVVPDTLCTLPWMHLEVSNKGNIKPCCVSQQVLGNIKKDKIKEIFFNDQMQTLRHQMLSGSKPSGCDECWNLEKLGLKSPRLKHQPPNKQDWISKIILNPTIKYLDLKPGIVCNFKCRICSPGASSMHVQEQAREKKIEINLPEDWIDSQSNQIFDIIDDVNDIYMCGGEPFLMKNLTRLIENIISKGRAKNIKLHYNSNGSIYPDFLIDHWKQFQFVTLQLSIDNIGARFELERGGNWVEVEKNIKDLIALRLPNLEIFLMPTISVMNVLYLDEIEDWANNLGLKINYSFLSSPEYLSISMLTDRAKQLIFTKYRLNQSPGIEKTLDAIKKTKSSNGSLFVESMKKYDQIRKEKFFKTHHEISVAMGYHEDD